MIRFASRRSFMAGAAALAAPSLTAFGPHPDAALIDLCARFKRDRDAVNNSADGMPEEVFEDACQAVREIEAEIIAIPARTMRGLAAKARAIIEDCDGDLEAPGQHLLASLLADIRAMASQSVETRVSV